MASYIYIVSVRDGHLWLKCFCKNVVESKVSGDCLYGACGMLDHPDQQECRYKFCGHLIYISSSGSTIIRTVSSSGSTIRHL